MENEINEQIYQEYYPKVFGYLRSRVERIQDAEDLAQTVFIKVYSKMDMFDSEKSSISTWIFNITRNTLIDHQRSMSFRNHDEIPETMTDDSEDALDGLINEESLERLADALEQLTDEERDLIIMHYYNNYTMLKIADMMCRPYGQIKRLHVKAIQKLKKYLADL